MHSQNLKIKNQFSIIFIQSITEKKNRNSSFIQRNTKLFSLIHTNRSKIFLTHLFSRKHQTQHTQPKRRRVEGGEEKQGRREEASYVWSCCRRATALEHPPFRFGKNLLSFVSAIYAFLRHNPIQKANSWKKKVNDANADRCWAKTRDQQPRF